MKKTFDKISTRMIKRYSDRFYKLGKDVKTLGWGSTEQQEYRFKQTLSNGIEFDQKSVLDIGCGFGDYLHFLVKNLDKNKTLESYSGFDLNPDLIQEAKKNIPNKTEVNLEVVDILKNRSVKPIADIGIMLGVLNFNLKDELDNIDYSKQAITNAFSYVNETLVVDFLSTNLTSDYPKEDFVFYHDPIEMLEFALTLTNNVKLVHEYMPIPQKEFMLILSK
jgi:SAM-dependent methyltransferase